MFESEHKVVNSPNRKRLSPVAGARVDTEEFRRSSWFSRLLRRGIKAAVIPRSAPENQAAYLEHFDDASRNVEIAAERMGRLIGKHPVKSAFLLSAIGDWSSRYFGTQKTLSDRPRYLVYTQHDHRVPFVPEEDILYTYMIAQISYISSELADLSTAREMRHFGHSFKAMTDLCVDCYNRFPSTMPRFLDHQRLTLRIIQQVDEPVNCCPSVHIAFSLMFDALAELVIKPHPERRQTFDAVRYATLGMFNSVLYIKQHAILDVAFGMLCAKEVFEQRFDRPFDPFLAQFPTLQREHPIPYHQIAAIYEEVLATRRPADSLADALGAYLKRHRYPLVDPGDDIGQGYFHTDRREIVRQSSVHGR